MPEPLSTEAPRLSLAHTHLCSQAHHKPPWQSCEQLFLVQLHTSICREQAKRQQTSRQGGSGAGFAPCCCTCPQKPHRDSDGTGTVCRYWCPWGQVTPEFWEGRSELHSHMGQVRSQCHQQSPPMALVGSLPKGFPAERASGM